MFKSLSVLVALFILALTPLASAKKIAFYWGGGGEAQTKSSTIFDEDLKALGPALIEAGYELNLAFGVGHATTEKIADRIVGFGRNKPFTVATVKKELEVLAERINSKEIKKGDQILFIISTHGDNPDDHLKVATHMVRVTNFKKDEGIGLDRLFAIRDLAEHYDIKFALLDFSCYAGSSLALASAKSCVVTSSSAQEVSYAEIAPVLVRFLKPNVDLETAFLASRNQIRDFEAPEISTLANSVAKLKILLNSSASSPIKPAASPASFNRHTQYLKEVQGKDFKDLAPLLVQIPNYSELTDMKSIRDQYQTLKKDNLTFDQLNDQKIRTLNLYYYLERILYQKIYKQFQNQPGPNPCQDFKF